MKPYADAAVSTLAIYLFLIAMMRLLGRRATSQLSPIDFLVILLLGSAVETAMVGASTSLKIGLVSATTLFAANLAVSRIVRRWKRIRYMVGGIPTLLVHDGQFVESHLHRVGLTHDDVREALRAREVGSLDEVRFAIMEPDGSFGVVRRSPPSAEMCSSV